MSWLLMVGFLLFDKEYATFTLYSRCVPSYLIICSIRPSSAANHVRSKDAMHYATPLSIGWTSPDVYSVMHDRHITVQSYYSKYKLISLCKLTENYCNHNH